MQAAHQQFKANIARVRELAALHANVSVLTKGALDLSDILRAEIVLAVSAFDTLIHELVRIGMLEAAAGKRAVTDHMQRFPIALQSALGGMAPPNLAGLDNEIRTRNGFLAFQKPDKVADAVRLITTTPLWPAVAAKVGMKVEDVRSELEAIVDRRNKIAHEADADPTYPGQRWNITPALVNDAVDLVERLGDAISSVV